MDWNKFLEIFADCELLSDKILLKSRLCEAIRFVKENYHYDILKEIIAIHNPDNTIELNYQKKNILINKVFQDADLSNVELNKRINIFKLNGDITNLEGIIATQSDYEKYIDTHHIMSMFFKRELISSAYSA